VQAHETVIEADYRPSPACGLLLTPDVRYVLCPGGTNSTPNALFLGLKTRVEF
jgi:carbohydrate-selective porin OprB